MNNKLTFILGGGLIVALVFLGILYKRQSDLTTRIQQLRSSVSNAGTSEELQKVINDFLLQSKQPAISLFKSKASGSLDSAVLTIDSPSGSIGTRVTISGTGVSLPSYVVFGPGVITDEVISQNPDTITFDIPSKVVRPVCPQFPNAICTKLGMRNGDTATEVQITQGIYTIYIANQQGEISNSISFEVK